MKSVHNDSEEIDQDDLPVIGSIQVVRNTGYGTVPDLDDEEPADIAELQRMTAWTMYGPLFELAGRRGRLAYPVLDENGEVDWDRVGAAGVHRRRRSSQPQGRAAQLRTELARVVGLIGILTERVPGTAKYLVLKYARMGILQPDHVTQPDLRAIIQLEAQTRRLQEALASTHPVDGGVPSRRHARPVLVTRRK